MSLLRGNIFHRKTLVKMKINRRKIKMLWRQNLTKFSNFCNWQNIQTYFSQSARTHRKLQQLRHQIIQKETPVKSQVLVRKNQTNKIFNFDSSFRLKARNFKKLFQNKLLLKRATVVVTILATISITYFQFASQSQGASYTFSQSAWSTQTANNASHPTNSTGWSEYAAKDAGITAGTEVTLANNAYSTTDDGTLTTTGSATGGGFANGANTNTQVSGTGAGASVDLVTGLTATTKTSDTDFAGGTHSSTQITGTGDTASLSLQTQTASPFTHTADTDFVGTHTATEVTGTGTPASVQLQAGQTTGTYESATIDLGTSASMADLTTATISQTIPAGVTKNYAWGINVLGSLGDNTSIQRNAPVETNGLTNVVSITSGSYHSLALKSDGTVWAWGYNNQGQLGDNTTLGKSIPVQVKGVGGVGYLIDIVAIAGGGITGGSPNAHSLALKADGTVWAWGYNAQGQLGDNSTISKLTPVQVKGIGGVNYLTDVVAIAGGNGHSLALKADGTVWAWGNNSNGQLGDSTTTSILTPVQTSNLTNVVAISSAHNHSIALKSDGTAWAWGLNSQGQLGDNTVSQKSVPVQIKDIGGVGFLSNVISISAGYEFSMALKADGTVWSWGNNWYGQLGDNTTTSRLTPVQVKGVGGVGYLTDMSSISAGGMFSLGLKSDGTVWAWGYGPDGELGDNTATSRLTPVQVKGVGGVGFLTDVIAIKAGDKHSLAITSGIKFQISSKDVDSGWVVGDYKWAPRQAGSSNRITIPNGLDGKRYLRYKMTLSTVDSVYTPSLNDVTVNLENTGNFTSGAINLGGAKKFDNQNFSFSTTIPAEIAGNRVKVKLSKDGTNWYGPNGYADSFYDTSYCSVATGVYTCAITAGTATILNDTSNLYYKVFLSSPNASFAPTFDSSTFNYYVSTSGTFESATIDLGAKADFSTASFSQTIPAGATKNYGWGLNGNGQLGDNSITQRRTPVQTSDLTNVVAVAGGDYHSLALKSDGTVWASGTNTQGQLGDNSTTQSLAPVQVKGVGGVGFLTDVVAISSGAYHSLALKSDGTVWAWGYNFNGQLGDNSATQRNTPVQVKGVGGSSYLTDVVSIAGGSSHSLALKSDGTVWAWGYNSVGQLGDTTTTQRLTPVQVKGVGGSGYLTDAVVIAVGNSHSLAIKSDGTVWAWGANDYGQLGDNSITQRLTPIQTSGLTNMVAIAGGAGHSIALKSDGTVWAWGYNGVGSLGDTTNTNRRTPVQTSGLTGVVAIASGYRHSLAVKSDGTVWAWGWNSNGQLGDNTIAQYYAPVQTSGLTDVVAIAVGREHSLAVKGGMRFQIAGKDTDSGWVAGDYKPIFRQASASTRFVIPTDLDGKRYIRYKVTLATADVAYAPSLNSLTLNYNQYATSQTLTSSKFDTTDSANTPANIQWTESLLANTDIKFQLRTSADGSTWTPWCGPNDGVAGSCNSATFFTDPTGAETIDDLNSDQSNDRWIQYQVTLISDGSVTPTVSDVTLTYVVNATPQVQNVTASQTADGMVTVNYQVRDPDTTTGFTANEVAVTLQYCTA
ncbi:MAG: hypothetical protein Q7T51_00540, partial [Candidatus Moranbacteria bacterium]|nr:hypothetical protein [Candidatus Moranbacteria bacterium]